MTGDNAKDGEDSGFHVEGFESWTGKSGGFIKREGGNRQTDKQTLLRDEIPSGKGGLAGSL